MSPAAEALRRGEPAVLPTDTVYGLCCEATARSSTERMYALKRRELSQPSALLAASVDDLVAAVPELAGLPVLTGAYTLVLPNPAGRFPWICGETPAAIGVRVPDLPPAAASVVRELGVVVATSANLHGGPDPRRVEELDPELRAGVGAVVDVGELPGTPSTVISLTGPEPRVLREGGGPVAEALSTIRAWPPSSTASGS
ncbi:MAG TPA: L-threonylcarbamoyladenylate synthase [Gaiellaceae bacterium]|nr:L-threonylcarbamoyladenylate synthase [Gaiellaceae bacterium]